MGKDYTINPCSLPPAIDADWDKPFWQDCEPASVGVNRWTSIPAECLPRTQVKLKYDDRNLYVIFRVQDLYVKAAATQTHGPVYQDTCVECFLAPDSETPNAYFNLETNCCGVLLAQYHTGPRQNSRFFEIEDCQKIQIASSASGPIRNEIQKPLTWTIEYALPLEILTHYGTIQRPAPGVCWRGNFYKCADDCSKPHWISWSPVTGEKPDFHRPESFGLLEFV